MFLFIILQWNNVTMISTFGFLNHIDPKSFMEILKYIHIYIIHTQSHYSFVSLGGLFNHFPVHTVQN